MAKRGRPKTPFDWNLLDAMLGLNASISYCAEQMLLARGKYVDWRSQRSEERRITREIARRHKLNFVAYRAKKIEPHGLKLFQTQLELANKGDRTMLIWLGKQLLAQKESPLIDASHNTTQNNTMVRVDPEDKHSTVDLISMLLNREPMRVLNPSQSVDVDDICDVEEGEE